MFKAMFAAAFLLLAGAAHGPSEEMFDRLEQAPTDEEAESVALDIWAAWLESGSPTVDILMERAVQAQAYGDVKHARELYDRVIRIQPDYAEGWHRRAGLFLMREQYDEALRDLNETLRCEPRHFGAWYTLGAMLESLGSQEEALAAYREALEIYPRMDAARQGVARLQQAVDGTAL